MQYIHPRRNHYAMTGIAGTILFFVFGILTFRRHGLGTDWARVRYMCMGGEYRTLTEAGSLPENNHLPPHLRLDKLSYLDRKDTEVAFPPLYNAAETHRDRLAAVKEQVTADDMKEVKASFGPFHTHTISMSKTVDEKFVRRKLDIPEDDKRRAAAEKMEREMSR